MLINLKSIGKLTRNVLVLNQSMKLMAVFGTNCTMAPFYFVFVGRGIFCHVLHI